MESTATQQSIRTADSVRETINQDGAVLLDIRQGLCFSMNPVGARIWEMLKRGRSLDDIVITLEAEFSVPRPQIEQDIEEFLQSLKDRKLIQDGDCAGSGNQSWFTRMFRRGKRTQNS